MDAHLRGPSTGALLEQTIGENLERTVARFPDRDALVVRHQDIRLTYAQLDAEVDRVARALLAAGLEAGDRVGMWAPNCAEWVLVQYATAKAGLVLVNVNPAYRTSELEHALRQSGCRLLIAARAFKSSDYAAMAAEVAPRLPALERVVLLDGPEWEELLAAGGPVAPEALRQRMVGLHCTDPVNIQYTSGTTGLPKGATLSHRNILNNGFLVGEGCGYDEQDRVCVPVPFYHCFGMVMGNLACTSHGAAIVVPSPAFEARAVLEALQAERCTSLYGVPTMFIAVLADPELDRFELGSLRTGIMAGAPCPIEVMRQTIDRLGMEEVTICYGMTETSPVSTQTGPDDPLEKRVSTVGRVHPHVEVKIVDPETGATVARGERGELLTRGYSVMLGYWEEPERTAEAIDTDGWMHTGDLATVDDEGYVDIVGRSKEMVIRGGENIYPREVEEFLHSHPDITDVAVLGVPDAKFGEELMAWIAPRAGAQLSEEDVRAYCQGRIAHFKIPRYLKFTDTFPMTVTGKVQKFKMREAAIAELGLEDD